MAAGVAGGLAEYLNVDPTLVRVLWIIGLFSTGPLAMAAYVAMWFVMPPDDQPPRPPVAY